MILRYIFYHGLMMVLLLQEFVADVKVEINTVPESVKYGDNLTIQCLIYNTEANDPLKTYFNCPFKSNTLEYCYVDCINICQYTKCSNNEKFIESFKCTNNYNNNPKIFSYTMSTISKEQINNRTILPFSCKYRGIEVAKNVAVISKPDNTISIDTKKDSTPSTRKSNTENSILSKGFFGLEVRNIILIILISSLITSFLLNVWCCVKCCIRHTKRKKRKKEEKLERHVASEQNLRMSNDRMLLEMGHQQLNDDGERHQLYFTDDQIRRAKSQPLLGNDSKSNPGKSSTSNLNRIKTGSMNNNVKYRASIYNNSLNDFYQNGSIQEYNYPMPGPQVMGYPYQAQFMPRSPYYYPPHPNDRMVASQSEDLNTIGDSNTPERRQSSIVQPLPSKPEDLLSNIESASSSHIV